MQLKNSSGHLAQILLLALVVSVALNVALAARTSQQRALIESGTEKTQTLVGSRIEGFDVTGPDGTREHLELAGRDLPTVVYSFRPGCMWCERNHEAVLAMYKQSKDRYRFVGLAMSSDGLSEYLDRFPLPFDVVSGVDDATLEAYQLGGTPRTLVIDRDGKIIGNWFGAFSGSVREDIDASLGVALPAVNTELD